MILSNVLFLTLSVAAPAASAMHLRPAHVKRAALSLHNVASVKLSGGESDTAALSKGKGKLLVRKKKKVACQAPFSISSVQTPVAVASQTSTPVDDEDSDVASETGTETWIEAPSSQTASVTEGANVTASAISAAQSSSTSSWFLVDEWSGNTFFDNWNFWSYPDPTHGTVEFVSASDAWSNNLVSINAEGHAVMSVDTTEVVSNGRKSVRIHGNKIFNGGLVIMDALHMPTGCGTWPAWWQNGPNWPEGGEIDILEGVNEFTQNQVSLHTGPGCTIPVNSNDNQKAILTTGSYDSHDCASANTSNQGCGARDETDSNSYGTSFNNIKGGVYAMRWSKAGITVWFFQRDAIPSDIISNSPDPVNWGTPMAHYASDTCNPYEHFYDHFNIFDTTFCGDWAGAADVWNNAGYAGQNQSCAAITGYSSCSEYVLNRGSDFAEAYWEVASVKYFNSTVEV
ncbi:hypothetical protein L204_105536 [Cryptococcus depauperatus]|nr:endo-1,3(4)-beta-glucanase [Cryptococcus depauperatus CBS 7855]